MHTLKEYEAIKREYIKLKELNSENIYTYLEEKYGKTENKDILLFLRRYYEMYAKYLFVKIRGSLRLEVSKDKAEKLVELKGQGNWEFEGMIDAYKKGAATCELGHPLRYVYLARNTENGELLKFGSRCVGDFFDLNEEGIKALIKIKDEMFTELKDIIAIVNNNLMEEHLKYDCGDLGAIIKVKGVNGLKPLEEKENLILLVEEFLKRGLSIPQSLMVQLERSKSYISSKLNDLEYLGIDAEGLRELKNSEITLISEIFTNSFEEIMERIKLSKTLNRNSDFYNYRNLDDFSVAVSVWQSRNKRLLKAQEYFLSQGFNRDWKEYYEFLIDNKLYQDKKWVYYGLEILMLFDKNIRIESSMSMPKTYGFRGYSLKVQAEEDFDEIISYMATKDFYMVLKEVQTEFEKQERKAEEEKNKNLGMLEYLRKNLIDEKYSRISGINGVRDIILHKNMSIDGERAMTERQFNYVSNIYNLMVEMDKEKEKEPEIDVEVNNRYRLVEKPEIISKIENLQHCNKNLPDAVVNIMATILRTQMVSDRQMDVVERNYKKYILGEEEIRNVGVSNTIGEKKNNKWNLIEKPEIEEKINELKRHRDYYNMPDNVKNIFNNILKYRSVSDKQIQAVENTYKRYYGGK